MSAMQQTIILALLTEAVASSFVVIDASTGIAAAHDALSLQHAPRALYFLDRYIHRRFFGVQRYA